ncbi:MAG TPA: CoA ester lyase [Pseudomonadales bacterium]
MTDQAIVRLRRSALYMPCSNSRALEKAAALPADVLLFDLEDAVAPDAKSQARAAIVAALKQKDYGRREKVVRINAVDSDWGYQDLKALADTPLDGLLLPKVESAEQINQALAVLGRDVPVWVMAETPRGVLNIETIAAHPQTAVIVMGTNDLAREMRVLQSAGREEFAWAFGRCVMAARACGCDILDGVYNRLQDDEGLQRLCDQARALGFDGKTLIHPAQLAICNKAFLPADNEVAEARAIVEAWQQAPDQGVLVVNGRLVEALHVDEAHRCLAMVQMAQNGQ